MSDEVRHLSMIADADMDLKFGDRDDEIRGNNEIFVESTQNQVSDFISP